MFKQFNNGACSKCDRIKCEYLKPVRYTDDVEPYTLWECIDPRTSYSFDDCPKGLEDWERGLEDYRRG